MPSAEQTKAGIDRSDADARRIGRNLFVYALSIAVPGIAALASAPVFTRVFSKEAYSQYVLALAVIAAASALNSAVSMSVIRLFPIAEKNGRAREFFLRTTRLALFSGAGIAAAIVIAGRLAGNRVAEGFGHVLTVAAAIFLLTELANVLLSFARVVGRSTTYLWFKAWQAAGALVVGATMALALSGSPAGALLGTGMALLVALPLLWRSMAQATGSARDGVSADPSALCSAASTRAIAAYGVPLMFAEFAAWGLRLSDRWMLQAFSGPAVVATYAAAYTISEATILIVTSVFQLALRPIEVRVWEDEGVAGAQRFATESTRIFLLMSLPAATLAWALARPLLLFAVPPAYVSGAEVVPWVVFSGVFLGLQHRFQAGIVAARKTERISYAALAGLAVNLALNFLFVPRFGMYAAGVTTLIGYGVFCVGVALGSMRLLAWRFPIRSLLVAALGSALAFAAARSIALISSAFSPLWVVLIGGFVGLCVYGAVVLISGEVDAVTLRQALTRSAAPAGGRPV